VRHNPLIVALIIAVVGQAVILFGDFSPSSHQLANAAITAAAVRKAGAIEIPERPVTRTRTMRHNDLNGIADATTKFGWMVEVNVLHGPTDAGVQYYLVARETAADVVAAVRSSVSRLDPEDDVAIRRRLSEGEIEAAGLRADEIRLLLPRPKAT
jgi:hypothetical protein